MDFGFFDGLLDAVFVINSNKEVVYCNDPAARICDSSIRRLIKPKPIFETIEFSDKNLFVMPRGQSGELSPSPYQEVEYKLKSGKSGKVQIAIQPFTSPDGTSLWVVMIRDVTVEEVLHAKYQKQLVQLENYSKNLEKMVEERTLEVKKANVMLNAIMNSLGQGFFVFDADGVCADFYTRACEDVIETIPAKKKVWDILKVPSKDISTFQMWIKAIYGEQLPFDSLKDLGPTQFPHSKDSFVKLEYFPLRADSDKISNVVVVATDLTKEHQANLALEEEKKYAAMVTKLITSKKQFSQFIENAQQIPGDVEKILHDSGDIDHETIFRILHTIEGEAATYSAQSIWQAARAAQEIIEPLKQGVDCDMQTVRTQLFDELKKFKDVVRSFLSEHKALFDLVGIGKDDFIEVSKDDVVDILRELQMRGVPREACDHISDTLLREEIGIYLRHYADVVTTVAGKLGKKVSTPDFVGVDTKIYSDKYLGLFSSLVHAYRNAVDHGLEEPAERQMLGKDEAGKIITKVETFVKDGPWLRITISDDGRGISADILREKLKLTRDNNEVQRMTDQQVIQGVFDSGVSTKTEVGEFSGRGIGMNAIKEEAELLGGRAWVETEIFKGTKLYIEVPDLQRVAENKKAA